MKKFKVSKGLWMLDSSGSATQGKALSKQADESFKQVVEAFKPHKLRRWGRPGVCQSVSARCKGLDKA